MHTVQVKQTPQAFNYLFYFLHTHIDRRIERTDHLGFCLLWCNRNFELVKKFIWETEPIEQVTSSGAKDRRKNRHDRTANKNGWIGKKYTLIHSTINNIITIRYFNWPINDTSQNTLCSLPVCVWILHALHKPSAETLKCMRGKIQKKNTCTQHKYLAIHLEMSLIDDDGIVASNSAVLISMPLIFGSILFICRFLAAQQWSGIGILFFSNLFC